MSDTRGEGSKNGTIIGHTKNGKSIYTHHCHDEHNDFESADHTDAAELHAFIVKECKAKMEAKKKKHKVFNTSEKVTKFVEHHENQAKEHKSKSKSKKKVSKSSDLEYGILNISEKEKIMSTECKEMDEAVENLAKSVEGGDEAAITKSELRELLTESLDKIVKSLALSTKTITPKKDTTSAQDMKTESLSGSTKEDEKMVKKEAAKHSHQGDSTPKGFTGQVVKAEASPGGGISNVVKGKNDTKTPAAIDPQKQAAAAAKQEVAAETKKKPIFKGEKEEEKEKAPKKDMKDLKPNKKDPKDMKEVAKSLLLDTLQKAKHISPTYHYIAVEVSEYKSPMGDSEDYAYRIFGKGKIIGISNRITARCKKAGVKKGDMNLLFR